MVTIEKTRGEPMWGTSTEKTSFSKLYPLFYGSREERNYTKGIKTIKTLAASGYIPAIFQLGQSYFDHLGVHRNYKVSFNYYSLAAEAEYSSAE